MRALKILSLTCLSLALGCGGKPAAKPAPPPKEVDVLTVRPSEVRETGEYLGNIVSRQSVNVLPQVAGYVRKLHVRPGQRVEAGAPLVEIDAREETAALDSAQAQVTSAQARVSQAKQTLARTQALFGEGLVSAQELERAEADAVAANAAAQAAQAQVGQRAVQLQDHVVKAAVPGVVGDVLVRIGDYVSATTQLTSVAQAQVLEVSVSVPADRARSIRTDTPIEVLDRDGKILLTSTVYFVSPQADPRTQLVEVKAIFDNEIGLRPSELVRTRVVYRTRDALQIPALAVVRQSGQAFALVVSEKDGKTIVQRRPITLGPLGETAYVVEAGLGEGDRVAVSGLQALRDGMAVAPRETKVAQAPHSADGGVR